MNDLKKEVILSALRAITLLDEVVIVCEVSVRRLEFADGSKLISSCNPLWCNVPTNIKTDFWTIRRQVMDYLVYQNQDLGITGDGAHFAAFTLDLKQGISGLLGIWR